MRWTLPNILTVFRLIAAPALGLVFFIVARPYADWVAMLLFIGASLTDYVDGYLARKWGQVSRFGAMLDPIADKAMVIIALGVLMALLGMLAWLVIPVVIILFREVFVSGLREFLGDKAGTLKVTKLAKWKTTVQMVAITLLFAWGVFEHMFGVRTLGMNGQLIGEILSGQVEDTQGLWWRYWGMLLTSWGGLVLLWVAALLTLVTGIDYFLKALPYLREEPE